MYRLGFHFLYCGALCSKHCVGQSAHVLLLVTVIGVCICTVCSHVYLWAFSHLPPQQKHGKQILCEKNNDPKNWEFTQVVKFQTL